MRGVSRCDGAGVVPGVDSGGRVELYVSTDAAYPNQRLLAIVVELVLRTSVPVLPYGRKGDKHRKCWYREGGETGETGGPQMRSLRLAIAERLP